jgi:hypothetical protein
LIKERWPGILGGLIIFIILIFIFVYPLFQNNDFNQELIKSVENGEPSEVMIPQIENKYREENRELIKNVNKHIMNINMWGNGLLASETDYMFDKGHYQKIKKQILETKKLRIEYSKREISKEDFLNKIDALQY